jgi:hypothetical protein
MLALGDEASIRLNGFGHDAEVLRIWADEESSAMKGRRVTRPSKQILNIPRYEQRHFLGSRVEVRGRRGGEEAREGTLLSRSREAPSLMAGVPVGAA